MPRPRGLGRGLASLIPEKPPDGAGPDLTGVQELPLDLLDPSPFQPRTAFAEEAMAELTASVRAHGVIQPIVVRPRSGGRYEIVVGERRVRACRAAGRDSIPAVVREWDDRTSMEAALVENLQRQDLNPMEEARAFRRLMEEFHWTQEEVAHRIDRSRPHVANMLRLLALPERIQEWIESGALSVAHGKALLSADEARWMDLAERAVAQEWTVRQLTAAIALPPGRPVRVPPDPHWKAEEARLRRRLGTRVRFRGSPERGRIEISYHSLGELERLLEMLNGEAGEEGKSPFVV
jgi:ParB family chromosome partitioning protein